jgi:hypothetical protein
LTGTIQSTKSAIDLEHRYIGCVLRWPVERSRRSLRVYVVEPIEPKLEICDPLFAGILQRFIAPPFAAIGGPARGDIDLPEPFDLLTFPEASVSPDTLLAAMRGFRRIDSIGCVHVGLHSARDEASHLFPVDEIEDLLAAIRSISTVERDDLQAFEAWLQQQKGGS